MSSGTVFGVPAFRRLWTAGLISDSGDWLLFIALPLVVFQISGSALGTSLAFLLELLPAVLLAPLAARLVGRFDRRVLMVVVNLGQAAALMPLLLVDQAGDLPIAYAVIVLHASLSTVFEPAKNSLLPDLVDRERLVSANALIGLNQNLGRLVGGPLAGLMLALGDLALVVAVDAITYLVSAALIASLPRGPHPALDADAGPPARLLAALRLPRLRGVYAVLLLAGIAQGMFLVLFVLFVLGPLGGTEVEVGALRGVQAIGAIAAGVVLGILVRGSAPRALTVASLLVFGALSLAIWNLPAVTTGIVPYLLLFAAVGAPGVVMVTGLQTVLQREAAERDRGAVFAAVGLVGAVGQGVGILIAGTADGPVGLLPLLEVQGSLYVLAGVWALLMLPRGARPEDARG